MHLYLVQLEAFDENEWWSKIEQMKSGREQEMIVKRSFSRTDQEKLSDMAYQFGLHFHAYNKGKILVVSKVPLPNYRADLDERHGSTQKEIRMSTETERRVGSLLGSSQGAIPPNGSSGTYSQDSPQSSRTMKVAKPVPVPSQKDSAQEKLSLELKRKQDELRASNGVKEIQSFREKLPAFKAKAEFLKAVTENQVLVISGETGCGKTTQLPQYILEEEISALRGGTCSIICTQPRRISAISVAARVSSERGETLGESVGYQIRLESKRSALTRLLFCTTGVLLRQLVQDPNLNGITHLLVDEIHERGMNEDFLLIILRDLLPRRPDLRLILMSATINADLFSKYFGNAPTIHIPGFTFPVAEFFLEDLLEKSRYRIQPESENMQGNSRRTKRRRDQDSKKDPLTELFEDIDIDSHYKNYSPSTRLSLEAWTGSQLDLGLVEANIEYICRSEGDGAILVFLTGWDEISKLLERIKGNRLLGDQSKYLVLPLHGSMPTINQREIFDQPPPNKRKIVLATNIAESSITIDDVVYVIDCGKAKETSYDALNKLACLLPNWISKASAHQRRGRAGRVQPGVCYRLYPKVIHDAMLQYQLPEILRTPLQELCLHVKSLQLGAVGSFLGNIIDDLCCSDHIALVKAFEGYREAKRTRSERSFCWENFLSPVTLRMMEEMREQFRVLLTDIGFVDKSKGNGAFNQYSQDMEMVSAVLCAGLYPKVVQCKRRGKRTAFYTKEDGKVDIHPASVNAGVHLFPLPYMVYSEKVKTTGIYVRDSTNISDYALLLFGGSLTPSKNGDGIEMLGGYLHFSASRSVLDLIRKLRLELDKLLSRKIEDPSLDMSAEGKAVVSAAVELLHSSDVHY
ncbi:DExH-box ATP-dependent RNA helicase DExH1 [Linum perenne]